MMREARETGGAKETKDVNATAGGGSVVCEVFRSPRREGMYLYVARADGLSRVPDALLERFGTPESALVFRLHAQRRLARVQAEEVMEALSETGFYLQMPPVPGQAGSDPSPEGESPQC